jgi:hypothetical protein
LTIPLPYVQACPLRSSRSQGPVLTFPTYGGEAASWMRE